MIRKGNKHDIDAIIALTKACATAMIADGIYQWNTHYPNKAAFIKDVERNELYVLETNKTIIGTIVISNYKDEDYIPIKWLTTDKANLYIHRLAVHPLYQKKGHAQQLMNFAERYAKTHNYRSIRLDTFSQNNRNQKFYELRGYKRLGAIYFPKQSKFPFYCYELVL
ncbi:GNAT family N-acetyltransferase [Winogradskyella sp.]|nr:GNAT family N-acetyltransferase [Winogradskyella sp.]